jgi:hypothetical protein
MPSVRKWIEHHQSLFKVTAQDEPDKFKRCSSIREIFSTRERSPLHCVGEIETDVLNEGIVPAQQMLDLYLLAIHWLLYLIR